VARQRPARPATSSPEHGRIHEEEHRSPAAGGTGRRRPRRRPGEPGELHPQRQERPRRVHPGRDLAAQGRPGSTTSSGTCEFQRPNRFRFVYRKPFEQTIVADGETLWLHDADLNQVTSRRQGQVLGSTPAALIAASPDLASLRKDFELQALPDRDGLQWVQASPKQREGQLREVKIGFRGNDLAALDITDGFGQRSVLTFTRMELNSAVPPETFQFKPPQGADLVKQ
jgi:outer membrane lipoprotein carrier protein